MSLSPNYLVPGRTTTVQVERDSRPLVPISTYTGSANSYNTDLYSAGSTAPIQISSSSGVVRSPSPSSNYVSAYGSNAPFAATTPSYPSPAQFGSSTGAGRSAKDYLLANSMEAKGEIQLMKQSQQVLPVSSGPKFESKIVNAGRPDLMSQSSYIGRDNFPGAGMPDNMKFNNFQYIAELERNLGEVRMEANTLKRTNMSNERQLTQFTKELEYIQDENTRLRNELHRLEQVRAQLEEVSTELERMKADRDFHNEQHLNLRKEMLEIVKQEYEIDSLKREKVFLDGELKNYKEKAVIYEKQIDELTILAKRPVSKNVGGDGNDKQEHYYAKKILELENKMKELKKVNDELRHENNNFKAGLKNNLDESKLTDLGGFRGSTPDSLLEQINLLKKKNESLKKENEIIRRELKNLGGTGSMATGPQSGDADSRIKELQKQIEQLTRKNIKLEEDLLKTGSNSNANLEAMELKMKLDEANRQIARLKAAANNAGNSFQQENSKPSSDYEEKMRRLMGDYLEQIAQLRAENEDLKSSGGLGLGSQDAKLAKLKSENEELRFERDQLKTKVKELQNLLEMKSEEVEILKAGVKDSEGIKQLMETNHRLMTELSKAQGEIRKLESSMNMSMTMGGNNSLLNPASQFMMT